MNADLKGEPSKGGKIDQVVEFSECCSVYLLYLHITYFYFRMKLPKWTKETAHPIKIHL